MPYRIFNHVAELTSCGYYRSVLPTLHLHAGLSAAGIEMVASNRYDESRPNDAYVFGRVPDQYTFMAALKLYERGSRIVWDIDDDFWSIPEWAPTKEVFGATSIGYLEESLKMASLVTVSTHHLASVVERRCRWLGSKVHVLENLIDTRSYFADTRRQSDFTRILWTGSHTHAGKDDHPGDLGPLHAVADHVRSSIGLVLVVFGYFPPKFADMPNVIYVPYVPKRHYEGVLSLISADISLLPLSDCKFNKSKSAIKYYETVMAGALPIASRVTPFADVIEDGTTGYLIDPDAAHDEWTEKIRHIQESLFSDDIRALARERVSSEYSWNSDNARRRAWHDFFLSLPDA